MDSAPGPRTLDEPAPPAPDPFGMTREIRSSSAPARSAIFPPLECPVMAMLFMSTSFLDSR